MARTARPARSVAVAAGITAGALLLGACSPTMTTKPYAAGDGSRVDFTDDPNVRGVNLMVLAPEEGAPGVLLGSLSNQSAQDVEFTLDAEGAAPVSLLVPAGEAVYLGTEDGVMLTIDPVAAIPGANLPSTLSAGIASEEFYLPVLDSTLPEYAPFVP